MKAFGWCALAGAAALALLLAAYTIDTQRKYRR